MRTLYKFIQVVALLALLWPSPTAVAVRTLTPSLSTKSLSDESTASLRSLTLTSSTTNTSTPSLTDSISRDATASKTGTSSASRTFSRERSMSRSRSPSPLASISRSFSLTTNQSRTTSISPNADSKSVSDSASMTRRRHTDTGSEDLTSSRSLTPSLLTPSREATPTKTGSVTAEPSASRTLSYSQLFSHSTSASKRVISMTNIASRSKSLFPTASARASMTRSPTVVDSSSRSTSESVSLSASKSSESSSSSTRSKSVSRSSTQAIRSASFTRVASRTRSVLQTNTKSLLPTHTQTQSATGPQVSESLSPRLTWTPTITPPPTPSGTYSASITATTTVSDGESKSQSYSPQVGTTTESSTPTSSPEILSVTGSPSTTRTITPPPTPSRTPRPTHTASTSPSLTRELSMSRSVTTSITTTITPPPTPTPTATPTDDFSMTKTVTSTITPPPTPTPTATPSLTTTYSLSTSLSLSTTASLSPTMSSTMEFTIPTQDDRYTVKIEGNNWKYALIQDPQKVRRDVQAVLASILNVPPSQVNITNLQSGSLLVEFQLIQYTYLYQARAKVETSLTQGSYAPLVATLSTILPNSDNSDVTFSSLVWSSPATTPSKSCDTVCIAVVAVCCGVGVVGIVIAVYLIRKYKLWRRLPGGREKGTHEPAAAPTTNPWFHAVSSGNENGVFVVDVPEYSAKRDARPSPVDVGHITASQASSPRKTISPVQHSVVDDDYNGKDGGAALEDPFPFTPHDVADVSEVLDEVAFVQTLDHHHASSMGYQNSNSDPYEAVPHSFVREANEDFIKVQPFRPLRRAPELLSPALPSEATTTASPAEDRPAIKSSVSSLRTHNSSEQSAEKPLMTEVAKWYHVEQQSPVETSNQRQVRTDPHETRRLPFAIAVPARVIEAAAARRAGRPPPPPVLRPPPKASIAPADDIDVSFVPVDSSTPPLSFRAPPQIVRGEDSTRQILDDAELFGGVDIVDVESYVFDSRESSIGNE